MHRQATLGDVDFITVITSQVGSALHPKALAERIATLVSSFHRSLMFVLPFLAYYPALSSDPVSMRTISSILRRARPTQPVTQTFLPKQGSAKSICLGDLQSTGCGSGRT